jgi:hypothetical protein
MRPVLFRVAVWARLLMPSTALALAALVETAGRRW